MTVELSVATDPDIPVLRRLMQFYLYEIAALDGWDLREDGTYGNPERIESFWDAACHDRFLVRVEGSLAGFVLTSREGPDSEPVSVMSEFFVLRRYRRSGVGRAMAADLFSRTTGPWRLSVMASNAPALAFWRSVIPESTRISTPADDPEVVEFRFTT